MTLPVSGGDGRLPEISSPADSVGMDPCYSGGDGSSLAQAVIIDLSGIPPDVPRSVVGVALEREWIAARFPGGTVISQTLVLDQGGPFDRLLIRLPSGEEKTVFFSIGSFFRAPEGEADANDPALKEFVLACAAVVVGTVGLLAWWTRATRLTEVSPLWIVVCGGVPVVLLWWNARPHMARSPLAGGRLPWVVAVAIVLLATEWLSIWHFFPGARVYLENASDRAVELVVGDRVWKTLGKGTSGLVTWPRKSQELTVRDQGCIKPLS